MHLAATPWHMHECHSHAHVCLGHTACFFWHPALCNSPRVSRCSSRTFHTGVREARRAAQPLLCDTVDDAWVLACTIKGGSAAQMVPFSCSALRDLSQDSTPHIMHVQWAHCKGNWHPSDTACKALHAAVSQRSNSAHPRAFGARTPRRLASPARGPYGPWAVRTCGPGSLSCRKRAHSS